MLNVAEFIKFLIVGALNTAIGLSAIYALMFFWGIDPFLSNLTGYLFGIMVGYRLNRFWTFSARQGSRWSLLSYFMVASASYAVNIIVVFLSIKLNADPYLAQLAGIGSYTILAYVGNTKFVFKNA